MGLHVHNSVECNAANSVVVSQTFFDKCQYFKNMVELLHQQFPKILKNGSECVTCGVLDYDKAKVSPKAYLKVLHQVTGTTLNIHTTRVFVYVKS